MEIIKKFWETFSMGERFCAGKSFSWHFYGAEFFPEKN
jgi:hypothetical protein